jgi:hypothetical protein
MPAPRVIAEAAYTAIIFLIDDDRPSDWLCSYYSLELGSCISTSQSVRWVLAKWDLIELAHCNLGTFESEPTLKNFLAVVVSKAKSEWGLDISL